MNRVILTDFLHLFVLVAFALAQPVYDLLGQNPEFFVSHKANPGLIFCLVVVLSIGVALSLVLFELLMWLMGEPIRRVFHWVVVFGLVALIVLPPSIRLIGENDALIMSTAIIISFFFTLCYARWQGMRLFVTVLSPAVVAFPLWFLLATPVSRLVIPDAVGAQADVEIHNPVPVVLVVMDEFNITALLDAEGRIDPVRYPNFAALAAESWWFPNAVAVSGSTEKAVPAILTGRQPRSDVQLIPTATDHPDNLFTLLGKEYHVHALESVATLCPDSICNKNNDPLELKKDVFWDVAAIYLNLIAPPFLSQQLPSLGAQWTGFGEAFKSKASVKNRRDSPQNFFKESHNKRDRFLENFLSQIERDHRPVLHFLHVLLPHVPYEYLASGVQYLSEERPFPDGMISEEEGWIGAEPLLLTAYHRYLQQVGYLDRFLGRLLKDLKKSQLYDDALIILTADHGVSFRTGFSRRGIDKQNAPDILKIPMIVKLPGKRQGKIDERMVSSVDILSTIADVLNVKVPWNVDGYSMIANRDTYRRELAIPGVGKFKKKDLEGFSRLKWQIDHFGEHTSFDRLVPKGPYANLIGKKIADLKLAGQEAMKFVHSNFPQFEYVKFDSGVLPALFQAQVIETHEQNLPLAISLNGQIWATTKTSAWKEYPNYISVLLPPAAFREGKNNLAVNVIMKIHEEIVLIPVAPFTKEGRRKNLLHSDQSGQITLIAQDGRTIPVEEWSGIMRGGIQATLMGNLVILEGWVADQAKPQPAESLLLFSGESQILQIQPKIPRPDVVKAQKQQDLLYSGFRAVVPLNLIHSNVNEFRVIVLSREGRAVHMPIQNEQKNEIRAALKEAIIHE